VGAERVETTQRFIRTVARIEAEWVERLAGHLIKYSYDEPHFSRKQGSALVMRRGSLFGLPISSRIAVPLAPLNPALARQLLIEHGLAEEELVSRAKFWEHNTKLMAEVRSLADKTRRRDLIIDPQVLIAFYEARIPAHVVDRVTLEKWDRELSNAKNFQSKTLPSQTPYLTWDDIVLPVNRREVDNEYPSHVSLGVTQLPLKYRYEPGHEEDGVSVSVPQTIVHQLHQEKLEWLVPGLIEEKLTYLIKSLPKPLRRQLVPVPDTVQRLLPPLRELQRAQLPFWKSVCEVISKFAQEPVKPSDFDLATIPQHLRMRIELVDEKGKLVQTSRDLTEVQQSQKVSPQVVSPTGTQKSNPAVYPWFRTNLTTWDIESLPPTVVELRGGVRVESYPTLMVVDDTIRTLLVDHRELAEQMLRVGVIRLFHRIERKEIRSHIQHFPQFGQCSLWLSDRFPGEKLRDVLGDLMARIAFVDTNTNAEILAPALRTKLDFDLIRLKRIERLGLAANEVSRWLPKLAEAHHRLRSLLEKTPSMYAANAKQIREQWSELWSDSFAWTIPWCVIKEYPRYLQSLAIRLDRLKTTGSAKDIANESVAKGFWDDYKKRLQQAQPSTAILQPLQTHGKTRVGCDSLYPFGKLLEYRWNIEELRVSIHSQQLGTRVSISPKRLEKLRDSLDET
jgi:ATP-dependent helicase HrpA